MGLYRRKMTKYPLFRYFKTNPEVIYLAVMLYVRFSLSLRNVEDLLHERGIGLCQSEVTYFWIEERSQR